MKIFLGDYCAVWKFSTRTVAYCMFAMALTFLATGIICLPSWDVQKFCGIIFGLVIGSSYKSRWLECRITVFV